MSESDDAEVSEPDEDLEPDVSELDVAKKDDWFVCRKFSRADAVILAYVCQSEIKSKAREISGYIGKQEFEYCCLTSSHSMLYRLQKYDWAKVVKDKLKNMVTQLRKKKDFSKFDAYYKQAEKLA